MVRRSDKSKSSGTSGSSLDIPYRQARQGSASVSSSRIGVGSSKRPCSSAASTGSTRSTAQSERRPGVEERPVRPKRRRVDSNAWEHRDDYIGAWHDNFFGDPEMTGGPVTAGSVNRPGSRFYRVTSTLFNPRVRPLGMLNRLAKSMPNREEEFDAWGRRKSGDFRMPPFSGESGDLYGYREYPKRDWGMPFERDPELARESARRFIRDYARYRLRQDRLGGPIWREARDDWLLNGGASTAPPQRAPANLRPARRARKPAKPTRRA